VFARVAQARPTVAGVLEVGGAKLPVESDFDAMLLRQVVAALRAAS
jgi:hypothetical protein